MEGLVTLFIHYATFVLVMVNQNNGEVVTQIFRYNINITPPVEILPFANPVTLYPEKVSVIQIIQRSINEDQSEKISGSVHLWLSLDAPMDARLQAVKIFATVIKYMKNMCGSLESVQLFREVRGYESKIFAEKMNFTGFQLMHLITHKPIGPRPKLFKIKVTSEDTIIKRVPIDDTRVNENDTLVLFCPEGIFMFFGKEVSYEEQETAEIFGKYIKLFDGKDYELQNTELNTITDISSFYELISPYESLEPPLSYEMSYIIDSQNIIDSELVSPPEPRYKKDFTENRYNHVWMYFKHENEIFWKKSPKWPNESFQNHFGLVDYEEETVFIHIPNNFEEGENIFEVAQRLEWLQKDLTKLSFVQEDRYTAEFLIYFSGKEKVRYMFHKELSIERNAEKTSRLRIRY